MSRIFKRRGDTIEVTPAADKSAGDLHLATATLGYYEGDVKASTPGTVRIVGVAAVPKKTVGNAIAQGERVSWDKSAAHALKAGHADLANGDIEDFGIAAAAAATGDAEVDVLLLPGIGAVKA